MKRTKPFSVRQKLEALKRGVELPVDPKHLHVPGTYLGTDEAAVHDLARAYQMLEEPDYVSISWKNQVKAANYFNSHGLSKTLDEFFATNEKAMGKALRFIKATKE
jgi:hypothetical protein